MIEIQKASKMFEFDRKTLLSGQKTNFKRLDEVNSQLSPKSDPGVSKYSFGIDGALKKFKVASNTKKVSPQNLKESAKKILDPQDDFLSLCNKLFFFSCILALAIDPLFFYLPLFNIADTCLRIDEKLATSITTVRTVVDAFYLLHMALRFRTAYIAPSSRVFGRGELVKDPRRIARRYLRSYFLVDFISVLPLPQIAVWCYLRGSSGSNVISTKRALFFIILLQYIPRTVRILPLAGEMKRTSGVFAESALLGAAYYLLLYMLASHMIGAFWYLLAVERQDTCWQRACALDPDHCVGDYLYCGGTHVPTNSSVLQSQCSSQNIPFNFGIYTNALSSGVVASNNFITKYCYCLWWGLQNLSTLGQGLKTSTYPGEVIFSIALAIIGLILFALLIGNMQTYLQSLTIRLEEMRVKRRDSDQWMHHRLLPPDLRERVRRYDQYKWLATRGVSEETIVQSLPKDLKRDIKRHLCLALVRRVPLFDNMDERLLDAICERLKPCLFTENTYIVREGDPVDEMLFIIRGSLESVTTDGGRTGFFNHSILEEGNFCGEELLTWALDPRPVLNFPSSTRTVKALTEVEAFALVADELKFVASQFRRLHSKQVQHTFRVYSESWRTWAACFIQAAWRRHLKRKAMEVRRKENEAGSSDGIGNESIGAAFLASKFAASALRSVHQIRNAKTAMELMKLQKPPEPDFGTENGD